ncbi:mannose-6-phosphate isomerase [Pseudomonas duriflava]|uniref:Mannose-6-phosphate isomerase n=1 Tax=Pseudomonas duriflava TaxID=459528 RepID=A0A562Q6M0_9PSED|nr:class I mannose-6-phosphate isomerase [Pseudomonas duriflava]TWI52373.1 mannose-6-phosphate isomerase [Pseudomonas duriflava]
MDWYPLRLTTPIRSHMFGGHAIAERLGKRGLPPGRIAETWEVSDVDGSIAQVTEGSLEGQSLRNLVLQHPRELIGADFDGPHFPILTKFIDGCGMLPVHLHADDETARRLECQPNGKTEAWHILWAEPDATALVGLKPGVDTKALRQALIAQDYDAVMRRLPVRTGETIYVPGGTLHSFGPGTLVYEVEQTSDIQQQAMPWQMSDGAPLSHQEWIAGIDALIEQCHLDLRPTFTPGLRLSHNTAIDRVLCTAGPYFALERWRVTDDTPFIHGFDKALILSNVGAPFGLKTQGWSGRLAAAETVLIPAAIGEFQLTGPADVLISYLPDLEFDIRKPLHAAGYSDEVINTLGDPSGALVAN